MSAKSNEIKLSGKFMVMWKEGTPPVVFCKKGVLRNFAKFTGKDLRQSLFLIKLQETLFNKEILTYVISCKFCEISKNTFCYRTSLVAASVCGIWCC